MDDAPGQPPTRYARVLVAAVTPDLRLRQLAESSFVRAADAAAFELVPYHAVFMPGQQYSPAALTAEMTRRGISAILIVEDVTTDAPSVSTSATAIPLCYKSVAGRCIEGATVVTGSRHFQQDKFSIRSQVFDVEKATLVWAASTRIERNGATDADLLSGLARDVVQRMVLEGVVRPR